MKQMFEKVDPLIWLLFAGMILYTVALFIAEMKFASDGVFFQMISNILSGFVASLFTAIKLKAPTIEGTHPPSPPQETTTQG